MFKDEILENNRRRQIHDTLMKHPGLHIRELQRLLDIPLASLQHHLNYMTQRNMLIEEKDAHYTRYYCIPLDPEEKELLSVLRHKKLREIVMMMLLNKKIKYRFVVEELKLPTSTVSFYLKRLLDSGIIERTQIGYENIYTIKDEERIEKILIAYQTSLLDTIVDKWASTWLENRLTEGKDKEEENE